MADKYDAFLDSDDAALDAFLDSDDKPAVLPAQTLSKDQIEARRQSAMASMARAESPMLAESADIMAGLTRTLRGVIPASIEEKLFPTKAVDKTSKEYVVGSVLDPYAMTVGGGLYKGTQAATKAIPKVPQYLKNVLAGGVTGAGISGLASETMESTPSDAATGGMLGAGISAILPPAAWIGGKTADVIRNIKAGPQGQAQSFLDSALGGKAGRLEAAQRLDDLKPLVPGESPTVGMAAVGQGREIPALKALEEGARARPLISQQITRVKSQDEAAREAVLEWIAKPGRTPIALQGERIKPSQVEAIRSTVTKPLYEKASKEIVEVNDDLAKILKGAEIQGAANEAAKSLSQAITNASVAGKSAPQGFTGARKVAGYDLPEWAMAPRTQDKVEPAKVSINALQRIKTEIDSDIAGLIGSSDGASKTKLLQLKTARKQLDGWMRDNSRTYADAQDTFKFLSEPQNQADVAEILKQALKSPAGQERETVFLNAIRNAPSTIKKATGEARFEQIGQIMTPTQMVNIDKLTKSLARQREYELMKAPQTILPEVRGALDVIDEATPNVLKAAVTVFRKAVKRAGGMMDETSQAVIDKMILNPKAMAEFLRQATPKEKAIVSKAINDLRLKYTGAGTGTAAAQTTGQDTQ